MQEAIRLFTVSTMDAARSGIHQQVNLTPEIANEIKVGPIHNHNTDSPFLVISPAIL